MKNRREWYEIRSTHADVLEALEATVAAHPSGQAGTPRRRLALVRSEERESVVVPFRPRVVALVPNFTGDDDTPTAA
jgi:hypothetical protein